MHTFFTTRSIWSMFISTTSYYLIILEAFFSVFDQCKRIFKGIDRPVGIKITYAVYLDIQNISLLHLMKSMKHIISIHANRAIIFSKAFIFSFIAQQGLMGRQWHHYNNLSKFLFLRVVSSMKISKQFFNYSSNMYIFSLWPMSLRNVFLPWLLFFWHKFHPTIACCFNINHPCRILFI